MIKRYENFISVEFDELEDAISIIKDILDDMNINLSNGSVHPGEYLVKRPGDGSRWDTWVSGRWISSGEFPNGRRRSSIIISARERGDAIKIARAIEESNERLSSVGIESFEFTDLRGNQVQVKMGKSNLVKIFGALVICKRLVKYPGIELFIFIYGEDLEETAPYKSSE